MLDIDTFLTTTQSGCFTFLFQLFNNLFHKKVPATSWGLLHFSKSI
jgi:hypothetical protein